MFYEVHITGSTTVYLLSQLGLLSKTACAVNGIEQHKEMNFCHGNVSLPSVGKYKLSFRTNNWNPKSKKRKEDDLVFV